jgi:cell division protease FtsH
MEALKRWYERVKNLVKENPLATLFLIGTAGVIIWKLRTRKEVPEIRLNYLIMALKNNMISDVVVSGKNIYFQPVGAASYSMSNASILSKDQIYKLLFSNPNLNVTCRDPVQIDAIPLIGLAISGLISYKLLSSMEQGPVQGIRRDKKATPVKFADIYGHEETKKDLREIIDYLKNPEKYRALGARIRRGVLLYGPSGTGKTMLAKAIANEAGVDFIYQSATEFLEVYVGVGPKRVRDLFDTARKRAPCIIFLDELDAVGKRFTKTSLKDNYETNATINQLLVEMDGFEESTQIVVFAASNREKFIETALLRSGRFDLKIKVDLPTREERAGILRKKLEKTKHNISEEDIQEFAAKSEGFCGADIDTAVNECIILSTRDDVQVCEREHLFKALQKISSNLVKDTSG